MGLLDIGEKKISESQPPSWKLSYFSKIVRGAFIEKVLMTCLPSDLKTAKIRLIYSDKGIQQWKIKGSWGINCVLFARTENYPNVNNPSVPTSQQRRFV
jgi:hypothetical protein